MKNGLLICGLNGSGKSTLGKILAEKLGVRLLDMEDLFFPQTAASPDSYAAPRSREEVERLLQAELMQCEGFVLTAVKGNYGNALLSRLSHVIFVSVPKDIRLKRVWNRSYQKFGDRMLPGGDLYDQEERFFRMVSQREDAYVEDWLRTLSCPVLRIDGTKPLAENIAYIQQKTSI